MPNTAAPLLVFLLFTVDSAENSVLHFVSKQHKTLDWPFGNNVLWSSNTRTVRECAVLCAADMRCSAFTLLRNASESGQFRICLGYSDDEAVGNQGDVSHIRAAVFRQVSERDAADVTTTPETATWVGTACVSDSDCRQLQNDTSCFHDTCVCTPGFFYSISSDSCVSECPPGKLAPSYMKYENRYLHGQNDIKAHTVNVQGCFDLCNASQTCLSIDFNKSPTATKNCYISHGMAQGPYQLETSSNTDYYQRQCE